MSVATRDAISSFRRGEGFMGEKLFGVLLWLVSTIHYISLAIADPFVRSVCFTALVLSI